MIRRSWGLVWAAAVVVAMAGCGQVSDKAIKTAESPVDDMIAQAQSLAGQNKALEAKAIYQQIVSEHPDSKNIEQVEKEMYDLNMRILFSNAATPQTVIHEVVPGDTLGKISKQYNITMDLIKTSNGMKDGIVRVGQKLRIWKGRFSIYVNKSQNTLMLKSDDDVLKVYGVSTGTNNITPVGSFKIKTRLENPIWYKDGAAIPPESPENVLGTRWLGFDIAGYGIHGTTQPDKIGQQVTAGCVRMRNEDVEELYRIIPLGTEVTIAN